MTDSEAFSNVVFKMTGRTVHLLYRRWRKIKHLNVIFPPTQLQKFE